MCKMYFPRCWVCKKRQPVRRVISAIAPAKRDLASSVLYLEEDPCGYWYCKFQSLESLADYENRVGDTCGEQMCDPTKCRLIEVKVDCCFRGANFYSVVKFATTTTQRIPVTLDDYLTPHLSSFQLARLLYFRLAYRDFKRLRIGGAIDFTDYASYRITVYGDVDRICLVVKVTRKDGDRCPQIFEGSYCRFLALSFWKEEKRRQCCNLSELFSISER